LFQPELLSPDAAVNGQPLHMAILTALAAVSPAVRASMLGNIVLAGAGAKVCFVIHPSRHS
jgi:hypothetical protein